MDCIQVSIILDYIQVSIISDYIQVSIISDYVQVSNIIDFRTENDVMIEDIYNFDHSADNSRGVIFSLTGITYADKNYRIARRNSDVTVIEYIMEGEGNVEVDGKVFHPKKGDTYLLPQGSSHCYYPNPNNPWKKIWINLSGQLMSEILNAYSLDNVYLFENLYTKDLLEEIVNNAKNKTPDLGLSTGKLVYEILYRMKMHIGKQEPLLNENARIMKDYINDHLFEVITLSTLSELIGMSDQHTIRIFKSAFGSTPYQYILWKKLDYAKMYLKNTNMSVKEISKKLAFTDEFYFSNVFKKKIGISPSEYKSKFTRN